MLGTGYVQMVVDEVRAALPESLRLELERVRIKVMDAPNALLVAEGVEWKEAGAFIVRGEDPMPLGDGLADDAQERVIYLFADNMVPCTRERVRDVFLHEVAHACGLDEDEVREALSEEDTQP
jgi:hypothetical protein